MKKNNWKFYRPMVLGLFSVLGIYSCESEDISIGSEVLNSTSIKSETLTSPVNTVNLEPEAMLSGRSVIDMDLGENIYLDRATVGVYDEPIFGKTKSDFYTQVRLSSLNPTFEKGARVDSIVLSLPAVSFSKDTLSKSDNFLRKKYVLDEKNGCEIKDTLYFYEKKALMKITSVYGNTSDKMNIQVHKVTENMGDINSELYSEKSFKVGELLGEKQISDKAYIRKEIVSQDKIDDKSAKVISTQTVPTFNIRLNKLEELFQQQVVNKNSNTGDQITFINNVLKGIKISTNNENGFIFTFSPNNAKLIMYYSYNNPVFKGNETCEAYTVAKRNNGEYSFLVGAGEGKQRNSTATYNVFQNQIENTGANISSTDGKIYLSGMAGNNVRLKITDLDNIKKVVNQKQGAITEAYIKVYVDSDAQGELPLPEYLHVYNATQKKLIPDYNAVRENGFKGFPFHSISQPYKDGYYKLNITQFIKNIVEKGAPEDELMLKVGNYINLKQSYFYKPPFYYSSNNFSNPYRLVAFGGSSSVDSSKRVQLEVIYSVK
ncbi:DUF4270 domain-containing protein [Weeksellaceae bacterium TAE3-ERU29]|nr:DUF4270 domain-containing protein [Weeksellaceae bacterium TAE3-ERU29]